MLLGMIEIKKKEGENIGSFLYRFNKKIQQSGVLKEVRKRRFTRRLENKRKRRLAAIYRVKKVEEMRYARKHGLTQKN